MHPKLDHDGYNLLSVCLIIWPLLILRIWFNNQVPFDLFGDEAQYWIWSLTPDFGYYSKPPIVAWLITLTTNLCGHGEACIRLASPILHTATGMMLYLLGQTLYSKKVGFWSAITYVTLPAVTLSSALISTDPALLFFWSVALYGFIHAYRSNGWHWWVLTGIAAGLGCMTKYNMVVFLGGVGLFLLWQKWSIKRILTSPGLWVAGLIALSIYLPNLWWNAEHGFVSYLHTKDITKLDRALVYPDKMLEFVGAQFGVFGPILTCIWMGLLLRIFSSKQRKSWEMPERLLFCFSAILFGVITLLSLIAGANANWAAPIYIAATVWVVASLVQSRHIGWLYGSSILHISIALFMLCHPILLPHLKTLHPTFKATVEKYDPLKRVRGWHELGEKLQAYHEQHPETVIITDERKTYAELRYYLREYNPTLLKWNKDGHIQDHFDLTADAISAKSQDVLFISRYESTESLAPYFSSLSALNDIIIPLGGTKNRIYHVYVGHQFKGY